VYPAFPKDRNDPRRLTKNRPPEPREERQLQSA
jgi:hypothetical protein